MADFRAYNTVGISYDDAMAVAMEAERSRDFTPTLGDVTVGLSSGTSGRRGLFLSSVPPNGFAGPESVLARMLPASAIRRILTPWMPPIRIAFFLRANSNLYRTIAGRRIEFRFFDLLNGNARRRRRVERMETRRRHSPADGPCVSVERSDRRAPLDRSRKGYFGGGGARRRRCSSRARGVRMCDRSTLSGHRGVSRLYVRAGIDPSQRGLGVHRDRVARRREDAVSARHHRFLEDGAADRALPA